MECDGHTGSGECPPVLVSWGQPHKCTSSSGPVPLGSILSYVGLKAIVCSQGPVAMDLAPVFIFSGK